MPLHRRSVELACLMCLLALSALPAAAKEQRLSYAEQLKPLLALADPQFDRIEGLFLLRQADTQHACPGASISLVDGVQTLQLKIAADGRLDLPIEQGLVDRGALTEQVGTQSEGLLRSGLRLDIEGVATSRHMLLRPGLPAARLRALLEEEGQPKDMAEFVRMALGGPRSRTVFVDCTDSEEPIGFYATLLDAGVHVVSSNKRPFGGDLAVYRSIKMGRRQGRGALLHETSVGAALPMIGAISDLVRTGDSVRRIRRSPLRHPRLPADQDGGWRRSQRRPARGPRPWLHGAQPARGSAGLDVARKILILAREGGMPIEAADVKRESLLPSAAWDAMDLEEFWRRLPELDASIERRAQAASVDGGRLFYLASATAGVAQVGLRRVESTSPFAALRGGDNMVAVWTDRYPASPLVIRGPGAGPEVTASGVFADIIRAADHAR